MIKLDVDASVTFWNLVDDLETALGDIEARVDVLRLVAEQPGVEKVLMTFVFDFHSEVNAISEVHKKLFAFCNQVRTRPAGPGGT